MNLSENEKFLNLEWKEESRKRLLKTVVLDVMETESVSPDGEKNNYIVMEANDWVITVPVLDDCFLMVKQWRHGEQNLSIEFPGGVAEKGEKPEIAAGRELLEETGYKANKLVHLGSVNPNPALMCNHVHIFVAEDLEKEGKQHLDNDEYVNYLKISQKEVYQNLGSKEYQHALMSVAMAFYLRYKSPQI